MLFYPRGARAGEAVTNGHELKLYSIQNEKVHDKKVDVTIFLPCNFQRNKTFQNLTFKEEKCSLSLEPNN